LLNNTDCPALSAAYIYSIYIYSIDIWPIRF